MKFTRVLVTGGAGFIGSHLVRQLVRDGYNVSILDNLSTGQLERVSDLIADSKANFISGDIRDSQTVTQAVDGVDAVIHLAAIKDVQYSIKNPAVTHEVNVVGTRNLLGACSTYGVKRFLLVSTSAVYGQAKYLPIDEIHPLDPLSAYADSKIQSEMHTLRPNSGIELETVVLRLFNVYGEAQGVDGYSGVITKFIDRIRSGKPPVIYGKGDQTRDFVSVKDVVSSIRLALEMDDVQDRIFNIGSGNAISILDLAKLLSEIAGKDRLEAIHEPGKSGEVFHSHADIERARTEIGFDPSVDLRSGLEELIVHDVQAFDDTGQAEVPSFVSNSVQSYETN